MLDIRREVVNHFTKISKEPYVKRACLDEVLFVSLIDKDRLSLSVSFSL